MRVPRLKQGTVDSVSSVSNWPGTPDGLLVDWLAWKYSPDSVPPRVMVSWFAPSVTVTTGPLAVTVEAPAE